MEIDDIRMTNTLQNVYFLGEFGELVLGGLKTIPSHLDALLTIQCLPNDFIGTFTQNNT